MKPSAFSLSTLLIFLLSAALAFAQDDVRPNVSVKTKRSTIGSRTLPRLADLTIEHSPNVAKAKNDWELAKLELENARVVFLPSLDLEVIHGLQDASPTGKDPIFRGPYRSNLNLTLTENLYDSGASLTKLRIAQIRDERLRLDYEYRRDQQLLLMAQVFYDWSASLRQREIDENNRDLLRRQYNILDAQYKQGLKTKRDILRIETEIRRLEMDVLRRDNDVDLNFQKLAAAIGISREELQNEGLEGEEPKPYSGSEGNAPELKASAHRRAKILEFALEQAELERRLASIDYWPQILLTSSLGYHNHDYIGTHSTFEETGSYDWNALITVKYNLWDFGQKRRNVEIARVKARIVEDDNKQILLDLGNELRDIWNRLREFRENVKMSRELLVIEQQSYSILEAEYRNGRGTTYLDLITNLKSLIDARSRFMSSYFGLRKQQMLYSFHKGELYELLE